MYCLNDKQIDFIINDISARGVEMEALQQNLLDHICCIVEQNLEAGGDFESFYQKTVKTFYKNALREIEEETLLLLTYKNYYTMKKTMIISGIFSALTMSLGIFFKFMHWPGAAILILLGVVFLGIVFLPLMFILKTKEKQSKKDKLIIAIGTLFGILISFSILFKIFHWPGANLIGMISIGILLLIFTPLYFFTGIRNPETKINSIVVTILLVMGCGLFLSLVNSRPSATIAKSTEISNQHLETTYFYASEQNKLTYKMLLKDTSNSKDNLIELNKKCKELCDEIEGIKIKIVQTVEGDSTLKIITFNKLTAPDNYDIPTHILFNKNGEAKSVLNNLKTHLKSLNAFVLNKFKQNSSSIINLSNTKNINLGENATWEKLFYYRVPQTCILRNFTQLQLEIRLIESNCIRR